MTFTRLCREIFLLAQSVVEDNGPGRGRAWENRVAAYLARSGAPAAALPGAYAVFGHVSLSGLAHQVDGNIGCHDALVIAEWKAHEAAVPKNELLRFKAASDDYYLGLIDLPKRPIMRFFGGMGTSSLGIRTYAGLHGIVVVDPAIWPAPVLAADDVPWPDPERLGPAVRDRRTLRTLFRPMQEVLVPLQPGGFRVPPPMSRGALDAALQLQQYWSDRLWEAFDMVPGKLEAMVARVAGGEAVA